MSQYDFERIKRDYPLHEIASKSVNLIQSGKGEWKCLCPFHGEKTPSCYIYEDGGFKCFGCGKHGDVVDWVCGVHEVDVKKALEILGTDAPAIERAHVERIDKYADLEYRDTKSAHPVFVGKPIKAWNHKQQKHATYTPDMVFAYRDSGNKLIGYVIRYYGSDGKKIVMTLRWTQHGWTVAPMSKPYSLYGIQNLSKRPDAQVVIAEGEKAADAVGRLLGVVSISWWGGTNNVKHTDWSPLQGRRVLIWGDADEVGEKAAHEVAREVKKAGAESVRIIEWDKEREAGWDAADAEAEGMTREAVVAWAKPRLKEWEDGRGDDDGDGGSNSNRGTDGVYVENSHGESAESSRGEEKTLPITTPSEEASYQEAMNRGEPDHEPVSTPRAATDWDLIRFLGYDGDQYYYLPKGRQQITSLTASGHNEANLLSLAREEYWMSMLYPDRDDLDKLPSKWTRAAQNAMFSFSERVGIFDEERIRGRGAWVDGGKAVINLGDKVLAGGKAVDHYDIKTSFIYEKSKPIEIDMTCPASDDEAFELAKICSRLTWEKKVSSVLLTGWCVVAPVCGILQWRPHIWITGSAGSGKSTVMTRIIKAVVGKIAFSCEGNTTEPAIRQNINRDARPVIMDEVESENEKQIKNVEAILDLARLASSGSEVFKGGTDGVSRRFVIRSAFCFSSINTNIKHFADATRIWKLVLKKNTATTARKEFMDLSHDIREKITPEFRAKMFSRTVANISTLLKNTLTFKAVIDECFTARDGDQIAPMLAGYHLCRSTKIINSEEAKKLVETFIDELQENASLSTESDEMRCLAKLMSFRSPIDAANKFTIGEMVDIVSGGGEVNQDQYKDSCKKELNRFGIRVRERDDGVLCVFIANNSDGIKRILEGTPWHAEWSPRLKMLPNAKASKKNMQFAVGINSHAVSVPLSIIKPIREEEE